MTRARPTSTIAQGPRTAALLLAGILVSGAAVAAASGPPCPWHPSAAREGGPSGPPAADLRTLPKNGVWIDQNDHIILIGARSVPCAAHAGPGVLSCIPVRCGDDSVGHRVVFADGSIEEHSGNGSTSRRDSPSDLSFLHLPPHATVTRAISHAGSGEHGVVEVTHTQAGSIPHRYRVHWTSIPGTGTRQATRVYLIIEGISDATDLYREVAFVGQDWPAVEFTALNRRVGSRFPSEIWVDRESAGTSATHVGFVSAPSGCAATACGAEVIDCIQTRACFMETGWKLMFEDGTSREADRFLNCCSDGNQFRKIFDAVLERLNAPAAEGDGDDPPKRAKVCGFSREKLVGVIGDVQVNNRLYRIRCWGDPANFPTGWTIYVHLVETRLDVGLTFFVEVERPGDPWPLFP